MKSFKSKEADLTLETPESKLKEMDEGKTWSLGVCWLGELGYSGRECSRSQHTMGNGEVIHLSQAEHPTHSYLFAFETGSPYGP